MVQPNELNASTIWNHMTNNKSILIPALMVASLGVMAVLAAEATAPAPKYTIKEVMGAIHKAPTNSPAGTQAIVKRGQAGKATKEDIDKMVEYYSALPANKPPAGDAADWKTKTEALISAAISLQKAETNAVAKYTDATNCKACHSLHKAP